jgi:SEC-C motif-containing protein
MSRALPPALSCPCGACTARGAPLPYAECCARYHDGPLALQAPTPEALMRSRYSAFVLDRRDVLLATWHPSTRPAAIEPPEAGLTWLGLQVRGSGLTGPDAGWVEFVARSKLAGRAHRLHETSRFVREPAGEAGRWFYVDGAIRG